MKQLSIIAGPRLVPLALLLAPLASPASAQSGEGADRETTAESSPAAPMLVLRASRVTGREIVNSDGVLGHVRESYVHPSGRILYYVMKTNAARPENEKHIAVPPDCMLPDVKEDRFHVDISREDMNGLASFDIEKKPWPARAVAGWCKGLDPETMPRRAEETRPVEAGATLAVEPAKAWTTEELIGTEITSVEGEELGKLAALGLDLGSGRIAFWILSMDGGADLIAIPWDALHFFREVGESEEGETSVRFVVEATSSQLEKAPEFDPDDEDAWRQAADGNWLERQYDYFGVPYGWYQQGVRRGAARRQGNVNDPLRNGR